MREGGCAQLHVNRNINGSYIFMGHVNILVEFQNEGKTQNFWPFKCSPSKGWVTLTSFNIAWKLDNNPCLRKFVLWKYILAQGWKRTRRLFTFWRKKSEQKKSILRKDEGTVQLFSGSLPLQSLFSCLVLLQQRHSWLQTAKQLFTKTLTCQLKPSILPPPFAVVCKCSKVRQLPSHLHQMVLWCVWWHQQINAYGDVDDSFVIFQRETAKIQGGSRATSSPAAQSTVS